MEYKQPVRWFCIFATAMLTMYLLVDPAITWGIAQVLPKSVGPKSLEPVSGIVTKYIQALEAR